MASLRLTQTTIKSRLELSRHRLLPCHKPGATCYQMGAFSPRAEFALTARKLVKAVRPGMGYSCLSRCSDRPQHAAPRGLSPVTDPIIARFAEACGASAPLHLRVDLAEGTRRAEGTVAMPFALVGRDDGCDVTLTDPEVNPRHAWLQVVGGRTLAVDLGSRAGLDWPGQGTGSGWLDVGVPVRIGQFQIRLCSPVSPQPVPFAPRYSPLQSDPGIVHRGPSFTLEFRNGKRARDCWTVNRLITLVGRASECKIRLSADDIAAYHCGLVLTPKSLWVVDLSGRGVVVNGERMRVSQLQPGADLWIGRFLIGLLGRSAIPIAPTLQPAAETFPRNPAEPQSEGLVEPAEDEVPLGICPTAGPAGRLAKLSHHGRRVSDVGRRSGREHVQPDSGFRIGSSAHDASGGLGTTARTETATESAGGNFRQAH